MEILEKKKDEYFPVPEETETRARFELFDRNGDGLLNLKELQVRRYKYPFLLFIW